MAEEQAQSFSVEAHQLKKWGLYTLQGSVHKTRFNQGVLAAVLEGQSLCSEQLS